MATLSELRAKVRSQTQTTDAELTDSEIDSWLQEAFNRTISAENQWPFYESYWNPVIQNADSNWTLKPNISGHEISVPGIMSVVHLQSGARLRQVDQTWAEQNFDVRSPYPTNQYPSFYSVFAGVMYLWPLTTISGTWTFTLSGYRKPMDWIADGASAEPDCDERLHLALANYATALAYAQQEDPELERVYMERWQRDVEVAYRSIMEPAHHRPMVMGPRTTFTRIGR